MNPKFANIMLFGHALFTLSTVAVNAEQKIFVNATFERLMEQKSYWGIDHLFQEEEHIYQNVPTPDYKAVYNFVSEKPGSRQTPLKKSKLLANVPEAVNEHIISVVVHPQWKMSWYANLYTFIGTHQHWGRYGSRVPGLWFCPNSFHLYLGQGFVKDGKEQTNMFLTSQEPLQKDKDNWVVVIIAQDKMTLYINGKENGQRTIPLLDRPPIKNVKLWTTDPYHQPAGVIMKDFKYFVLNNQPSKSLALNYVAVSGDANHVWALTTDNSVRYRNGLSGSWKFVEGSFKQIAVSGKGDHVWGISPNEQVWYRNGFYSYWQTVDGRLSQVSVNEDGDHVWAVSRDNKMYYRNGLKGHWRKVFS